MLFGYARVSTQDQSTDLQFDALAKAGVEPGNIYSEKITGTTKDRPQFIRLLSMLRKDDTLIVYSLSRAGRSLKNLIELIEQLKAKGVNFVSLKEQIDTTTAAGNLIFGIFAALSQFERDQTSERVKSGLDSARARGRVGGRPFKDSAKVSVALRMYDAKTYSIKEITEQTGIGKTTLFRYIKERATQEASQR
ncbi:recombinase family protein [Desulfosporosinus sp. BG]|uniref:recombinase family protein n=1 Tax=Desulfosporosinus sp. BG TaxID=1633135 RepID=UPI00083A9551|nr:recombinase family protein [Desulfosporosinus sp. BG]ODA41246.1 Phage DNA invertase [Desulfosporosinus sp. BG]